MAHVPPWRPDVQGEADLVEEVARIASLTKLVGKPFARAQVGVPKPILTPDAETRSRGAAADRGPGLQRMRDLQFHRRGGSRLFGGGDEATRLENPISSEMSHMRPALLPGLLQAAARNQARGFMDLALFEVGAAFHGGEPGEQHVLASGILVGHSGPKDVHGSRRPVNLYDVKADAEAVLSAVGAPAKVQILRGAREWWHPGRSGTICLGPKKVLGVFGELHPRVIRALDVKGPVVGFTLFLEAVPLPKPKRQPRGALELRDLQAVERDFAFVVEADVEALTLVNAAKGADKALIEDVRVFDEFIGGAWARAKNRSPYQCACSPWKRP